MLRSMRIGKAVSGAVAAPQRAAASAGSARAMSSFWEQAAKDADASAQAAADAAPKSFDGAAGSSASSAGAGKRAKYVAPSPIPIRSLAELEALAHAAAEQAANAPALRGLTMPLYRAPGRLGSKPATSRKQAARFEAIAAASAPIIERQQAAAAAAVAASLAAPAYATPLTSSPAAPIVFGSDLALKARVIDAILTAAGMDAASPTLGALTSVNDVVAMLHAKVSRKQARVDGREKHAAAVAAGEDVGTPANVTFLSKAAPTAKKTVRL